MRTLLFMILTPLFAIIGFIVDLFRSRASGDDEAVDEFDVPINRKIRF